MKNKIRNKFKFHLHLKKEGSHLDLTFWNGSSKVFLSFNLSYLS